MGAIKIVPFDKKIGLIRRVGSFALFKIFAIETKRWKTRKVLVSPSLFSYCFIAMVGKSWSFSRDLLFATYIYARG